MPFNKERFVTSFPLPQGHGRLYSLPLLEEAGYGAISRLPVCIRIVLEALLRNFDGVRIEEEDIRRLASWGANDERVNEIPFIVARVLLQDFTGVPLGVDLAAMRSAVAAMGGAASIIEPLVPVDLVIDHSVQVDFASMPDAFQQNLAMEFKRNRSRYTFLKWCRGAFDSFEVIPPGIGICHQVNLEYLAQGVLERDGIYYPDTLVGTDSHTTMINGLGVVGWGVGGIEAEAGMLGQPVFFLTPDVVGVHLSGKLPEGATATDLVLRITEMLRKAKVVGKFVEFFGEGAASLPLPDRATIANMAPEYGATIGFFPVDEKTCDYLLATGRSADNVDAFRNYYAAQKLFGMPQPGQCDYSTVIELDLGSIVPSIAGPKRPQDRIDLSAVKDRFTTLFSAPISENGYQKPPQELSRRFRMHTDKPTPPAPGGGAQDSESIPAGAGAQSVKNTSITTELEMINNRPTFDKPLEGSSAEEKAVAFREEFPLTDVSLAHGDVLIAAITSCTNTSNPSVMLAAGLLARNAVERGLTVKPTVKRSLAPGSRAVTGYLEKTGLQRYLDALGFHLVGYGCTTCIGNSGPLDPAIEEVVQQYDVIAASVLSGNRNFEARVHQSIKANFLMSPPLVVAYAIAGTMTIDLTKDPIGTGKDGAPVFLRDIWPSLDEVYEAARTSLDPEMYRRLYREFEAQSPLWEEIPHTEEEVYTWDRSSTYIQEPPFFEGFALTATPPRPIEKARLLAMFGDSVTTDHISPAGAIKPNSPAGLYLQQQGVPVDEFNSYGARRGNHHVMVRGTFANVRIKNLMIPGTEGGVTLHQPSGEKMTIFDASERYQGEGVPLIVIAGQEYGTGSSRDWAAKGTKLLGVRAVIAQSFERIHRSNLIGMGVLPCQFDEGVTAASLGLKGDETFDFHLDEDLQPRRTARVTITSPSGTTQEIEVLVRIDTPIEVEYYRHGGILPYVLRGLIRSAVH